MLKKIVFKLLKRIGYKIENFKKKDINKYKEIEKLGVSINKHLLFKAFNFYEQLMFKYSDLNIEESGCGFIISFNELKFYIETVEEFYILTEVFVDMEYGLKTSKKFVVFDIGMNIGIVSLFFARKENVHKIHSFEPVYETYNQALKNINLNSNLKTKIKTYNFGLGDCDRIEEFYFNKEVKGNSGVRGLLSPSMKNKPDLKKVKVEIKNIIPYVSNFSLKYSSYNKLIKIDCEGGEYEIIEKLHQEGEITKFDYYIIEWHDKGANSIENILKENKYDMISINLSDCSGIIYAFKV